MDKDKKTRQFEPGQVIMKENTTGDCAYIIITGSVEISKFIEGEKVVLDRLGPGNIFGEMALLDDSPRSATVTAVVPSSLVVIDRKRFRALLKKIPKEALSIFTVMSERLRQTSRKVSVLTVHERLIFSICSVIYLSAARKGSPRDKGTALSYIKLVQDICRILALEIEKIERVIDSLAQTGLMYFENADELENKLLVIKDDKFFEAFIDFLTEKLSYIPGFPLPSRKYTALSDKAKEILFFLKNKSGSLPRDKEGCNHYDFDRYVKESVNAMKIGVKDAILLLQKLRNAGAVRIENSSELVESKVIIYNTDEIIQAQMILVLSDEFKDVYWNLIEKK